MNNRKCAQQQYTKRVNYSLAPLVTVATQAHQFVSVVKYAFTHRRNVFTPPSRSHAHRFLLIQSNPMSSPFRR